MPAGPLDDGTYRFEVRATDAAGNVGAPAVRDFTIQTPGCFSTAVAANEGPNSGDLTANSCGFGEAGDAQASCQIGTGPHQWWSFAIPAGESATFTLPADGIHDFGLAVFTQNSSAGELACRDQFGAAGSETFTTTNPGPAAMAVYIQVFALAGQEAPYTLDVDSGNCFADASQATEGANTSDLSTNGCPQGADAQPTCATGTGVHQWWSFDIPPGETASFTASTIFADDLGVALFTANDNGSEIACKDVFGPGGAETATTTNPGASAMTVYIQVFALPGHEGPYTLTVASSP